jgi:hypothetical protein
MAYRITVTELIERYLRRLRDARSRTIHPEIERISGLVPSDVDTEALYNEHVANRHNHDSRGVLAQG